MNKSIFNQVSAKKSLPSFFYLSCLAIFCGMIEIFCYMFTCDNGRNGIYGMFANAQSGNIALMLVGFITGDKNSYEYLFPIFGFIVGLFLSGIIQKKHDSKFLFLSELLMLILLIFIIDVSSNLDDDINNNSMIVIDNLVVSFLLSAISGYIVIRYRFVDGDKIILTMCNGMLVSAIECAIDYKNRKKELLTILSVIAAMIIGMAAMGFIYQAFAENIYEYRSYCLYLTIIPLIPLFFIDDKFLLNKKK
jgi:uncharacterized membrane protein YoaK (UPF0700 family)